MPIKLNPDKFKHRTGGSGPMHPGRKGKFKATLTSVEVPFKKGDESSLNIKTETVLHNTVPGDDALQRPVEGVRLIQYSPITGVYKSGDVKGEPRLMEVAHLLTYTGTPFKTAVESLNKAVASIDETTPEGVKALQKAVATVLAKHAVGKPVGVFVGGLEDKPYRGAYKCDFQIIDHAAVEEAMKTQSAAMSWSNGEIAKIEKSEGRSAASDVEAEAANIDVGEIPADTDPDTEDGVFDLPE